MRSRTAIERFLLEEKVGPVTIRVDKGEHLLKLWETEGQVESTSVAK